MKNRAQHILEMVLGHDPAALYGHKQDASVKAWKPAVADTNKLYTPKQDQMNRPMGQGGHDPKALFGKKGQK
jgi:hypothetical protein